MTEPIHDPGDLLTEELPNGVLRVDWESEKTGVQNPCIRSYLGCIKALEDVLDSNYAILHCSPTRLLKIWNQVRTVRQLVHSEISPRLTEPSVIPALGEARRNARRRYEELAGGVLPDFDRFAFERQV